MRFGMKKLISPILAASLLIANIASAQESLSEKLKLSERVSAFMNPPSKQERKEELTRLEKAFTSVKAKYRRVVNCLAGKQACNKSDFAILGASLVLLSNYLMGGLHERYAQLNVQKKLSPTYKAEHEISSVPALKYNPLEWSRKAGASTYKYIFGDSFKELEYEDF